MQKVTVVYFETGETTPRVVEGMLHDNVADSPLAHQIEKMIEMDDLFGTINPIVKMFLRGKNGEVESELKDLARVEDGEVVLSVMRQQESNHVSQYCLPFRLKGSSIEIDSFDVNNNQCLRFLDCSLYHRGGSTNEGGDCRVAGGGLRRVWPGDKFPDGTVSLQLESIPVKRVSAAAERVSSEIPPQVVDQNHLSSNCDPVDVFQCVKLDEVAHEIKKREMAWKPYPVPNPRKSYTDASKLKDAIRHGISSDKRATVYRDLMHVQEMDSSAEFSKALKNAFHSETIAFSFEPRFVPHFQGELDKASTQYGLNTDGVKALKRILCALGETHPDIHSCPLAIPIASLLLHHLPSEDVYCGVDNLISNSRHKNISQLLYFLRISQAEHVSQAVVAVELLRRRFPKVVEVFVELEVSLVDLVLDVVGGFFTSMLPIPYVWRILDSFLNEGHKVIIRYVLALFKHLEVRILNCLRSDELEALFDMGRPQSCFATTTNNQFLVLSSYAFNMQLARKEVDALEAHCRHEAEGVVDGYFSRLKLPPSLRQRPMVQPHIPSYLSVAGIEPLFLWSASGMRTSWKRIFSAAADGWSLSTLYRNCSEVKSDSLIDGVRCIIFIELKTVDHKQHTVIGAALNVFPSSPSIAKKQYLGSEHSFVFGLGSKESQFIASGKNKYYLLCEDGYLTIGGGGDAPRPAIRIGSDLQSGVSYACETFNSPPFTPSSEGGEFEISALDIFEIGLPSSGY